MRDAFIDVEPDVFDAASQVFGQKVTDQLTKAVTDLEHTLYETGAMAGTDPGGTAWASSYDNAASVAVGAMTDLTNASYVLAAMLEQTGFNHDMAEDSSNPSRAVPSAADITKYAAPETLNYDPQLPSANGGSGHPPHGWGLIQHLVGYVWPNGDQHKLRTAARAWSSAADQLDGASYLIPEAIHGIRSQQSPEVDDAVAVCQAMSQHIEGVAASCRSLSTACSGFADHIDKAHKEVEDELVSLIEWTVVIEAGGALAGAFSFGIGEGVAQGVEAARIATTATGIGNIIARLIEMARAVAETIASIVTTIGEVAQRLKLIIGAKLSKALTTLVARLPKIVKDSGDVALDRLSVWAKDWSTRGLEIEKKLGGNLPRSFPTIDKLENGVATSIKSIDLTSTTYQDMSALGSKLRGYVDKVAGFRGANWSDKRILPRDVTQRVLQVAIQPGVESATQRTVLDQLDQYATSKGVKLIISEVP